MKNIYEILKEFGLEIPEEKKADFDKTWKENYRTKSEYDNAVTKRDEYKTSLDTVNEKLKEFEGVNVEDLKGQITQLQSDLKAKDDEYAAKEADRLFNDTLFDDPPNLECHKTFPAGLVCKTISNCFCFNSLVSVNENFGFSVVFC